MVHDEITIADILDDPLILQLMQADGVSVGQMERLLLEAAQAQGICNGHPIKVGKIPTADGSGNPRRHVYAFPDGQLPLWNPDKT
ncbi:hypothetical protein [Chelativorans sp. AA-79]|uniref:hypothetical protein n=1 Tax=Chelativorans sp. AA-79 TaxID=3028735 RepID=UPI0023F7ECAB|nr:hypothetical protein [Chelativorans sp. AA-79]WEX07993.1 hypothetical protein PVE73_18120 [Chelativorans sp. AA-79]